MATKRNAFKIETGIPIPAPRAKYPFGSMEIGDSFLSKNANAKTAAVEFARRHGMKFATRKVEGGWRVWRIA